MQYNDVVSLIRKEESAFKIIAEETLGATYQQLLLYPQKEVSKEKQSLLIKRLEMLKKQVPVQYILGKWEFEGREFKVGSGVLIPREDTEAVVSLAKEILSLKKNAVFADLGSGSGCIAVTLNLETGAKGYSVERSKDAFRYLEENIKAHKSDVTAVNADMLAKETIEALPQLDMVVSNPPYISKEEMDELDLSLSYEPKEALFGGDDGLYFYREIARLYYPKIKKGGAIAFEVGFRQADAVSDILKKAGFHSLKEKKDINGVRRAVCAFK